MKPRSSKKHFSIEPHIKKFNNQVLKYKGKSTKKFSILTQIKRFKKDIARKKHDINTRHASINIPQKRKNKNILPLPQPKKRKVIDSTILRENNEEILIGSDAQRKTLPLTTSDSANIEYFTNDKCLNCNIKFLTIAAKKNHVNIYRNKKDVKYIPVNIFDLNKHMLIICLSDECCKNFRSLDSYYEHIANTHNQLPTDTVPIFQNPDIHTKSELACQMCRGEFTNKSNLQRHQKNCTGYILFFCELCSYSNSDFDKVMKHGKNTHQKSYDFEILEEFRGKENENSKKRKISKLSTIYKTYTKKFNVEYTSMTEALSTDNLRMIYKIIKNTKIKKEDFNFSICTPVIISKTTEYGIDYRQRYFRTKAIRAGSKQAILSAIRAAKLSILLMAEHLEETGSGWIVQHCRRLDLIISGLNGVRYFHKKIFFSLFFFIKILFYS